MYPFRTLRGSPTAARTDYAHAAFLENLGLADDTRAWFLRDIEGTPRAGQTTIMVTSDHSWRTPCGGKAPKCWERGSHAHDTQDGIRTHAWISPEEARYAQAGFHQQSVFLIPFPSQTTGTSITSVTDEMVEHDIVEAMLRGKVKGEQDLHTFVELEH